MRTIAIDDVEVGLSPLGVHSVRKQVSDAPGTGQFATNRFESEPGESFSGGLYTHHDQEEVFCVQSGEATFDVADRPDSSAVGAGGVIRFPPGQFQEGYNDPDNDDAVVGFAFGAPSSRHEWDEIESVLGCAECGEETGHGLSLTDEASFQFTCNECGNVVSF